jgi:archaellum component FlaF (FlaF/FlaG flagellin family)
MRTRLVLVAGALSALLVLGAAPPAMAAPTTDLASLSSANVQGNNHSGSSAISKNGRFVAFDSLATNLIGADTNTTTDIFVRNRQSGKTTRASKRTNGAEANGQSFAPQISDSGRFVAFSSFATNLIGLDGNGVLDVFVHDRNSKKTTRVSTRSNGGEANSGSTLQGISGDGRYVVFNSNASNLVPGDSNGTTDIFVKDRKTGKTTRVSERSNGAQGNGASQLGAISPNGRYVAFTSVATNLVPTDSNATQDVFVHDRNNKKTIRASVKGNNIQSNNFSHFPDVANNGSVVFPSLATNLVNNDTNATWDAFLRNIKTKTTRIVSVSSAGIQGNAASGINSIPKISADGKRITFDSQATNLIAGDTNVNLDVFMHNRANQTTRRLSVRFDGTQGNAAAIVGDMANTGRFVSFLSNSTNLVGGDANARNDVFVRGPLN